jgi:cupin fold WbuC family metalloprotein
MHQQGVQLLDTALFETLIAKARQSSRLRVNHNFHSSMEENPHRFLNVLINGTYIAPHRHRDPPKTESFLILEGEAAFFTFADAGEITSLHHLGKRLTGIDVAAGVWHTMLVLTPHAVCYEVKPGPYSATNDKDLAPWAPREGHAGAAAYLRRLTALAKQGHI